MKFQNKLPAIDVDREINFLVDFIRDQVQNKYKRDGIVVGISGGIDSALTTVLSQKAVGSEKMLGLIMPEKESNPISARLAAELAGQCGIKTVTRDLTPILESFGAYSTRDTVVKKYFPEYNGTQKWKLAQPGSLIENDSLNFYSIKMENGGTWQSKRINVSDLRTMVGATSLKQRTRMLALYQAAESHNYMVAGTTNLSEADLGFFVKYGDGGVDIEPLAHLYKTYIFQIAEKLNIPRGIIERLPSPDTFSAEVSDNEFFFRLPFETLDLFLWALRDNVPVETVAQTLNMEIGKAKRIFNDIRHKNEISAHMRIMPAQLERILP